VEEEALEEGLQELEEEETSSEDLQPGKATSTWKRVKVKMSAFPALARPLQKKISPTPPPLSEEMRRKTKEGLSLGLAVQGGTNGRPEFTAPPRTSMKQMFTNSSNSLLHSAAALFIGGLWETIWLFLLTKPYAMLSKAQYISQEKLSAQVVLQWKWMAQYWTCVFLRFFIRIWCTGKWVAILALALMEREEGEALYWYFKLPLPSIIYTAGVSFFPFIYIKTTEIFTMLKGLWRQPSRRHGRHESPILELSGHRWEP